MACATYPGTAADAQSADKECALGAPVFGSVTCRASPRPAEALALDRGERHFHGQRPLVVGLLGSCHAAILSHDGTSRLPLRPDTALPPGTVLCSGGDGRSARWRCRRSGASDGLLHALGVLAHPCRLDGRWLSGQRSPSVCERSR